VRRLNPRRISKAKCAGRWIETPSGIWKKRRLLQHPHRLLN